MASVRDLWNYGTGKWLSYRSTTSDQTKSRWPVADEWRQVQAAELEGEALGLERARSGKKRGELRKLRPSLVGYLANYGALIGTEDIEDTLGALPGTLIDYERISGVPFAERIRAKRAEHAAGAA